MKKRSLNYFLIQYAGMPTTEAGIKRFVFYALLEGYTKEEIIKYMERV